MVKENVEWSQNRKGIYNYMDSKKVDNSEMIEDNIKILEREAYDICNAAKVGQRNGDSCDSREKLERLLGASVAPTAPEWHAAALPLIEFYSTQPCDHEHDSKGMIKLASLKQDWCKKGVATLTRKMEGMWIKLNSNNDNQDGAVVKAATETPEPTNSKRRRLSKKTTAKERFIENGKTALSRAAVRKVSRNLTEVLQTAGVNMLCAGQEKDDDFKQKIGLLLGTDLGKAAVGALLSVALEMAPIPGLSQEIKEDLIAELHTDTVDNLTMPLENLVKAMLPMISSSLTPLLPGGSSSLTTPKQIDNKNEKSNDKETASTSS